jgi:hypothetical protein
LEKKLYLSQALPASNRFHVFESNSGTFLRALCGKVALTMADPERMEEIKGDETYEQGQDCKECFRRAKLSLQVAS